MPEMTFPVVATLVNVLIVLWGLLFVDSVFAGWWDRRKARRGDHD